MTGRPNMLWRKRLPERAGYPPEVRSQPAQIRAHNGDPVHAGHGSDSPPRPPFWSANPPVPSRIERLWLALKAPSECEPRHRPAALEAKTTPGNQRLHFEEFLVHAEERRRVREGGWAIMDEDRRGHGNVRSHHRNRLGSGGRVGCGSNDPASGCGPGRVRLRPFTQRPKRALRQRASRKRGVSGDGFSEGFGEGEAERLRREDLASGLGCFRQDALKTDAQPERASVDMPFGNALESDRRDIGVN